MMSEPMTMKLAEVRRRIRQYTEQQRAHELVDMLIAEILRLREVLRVQTTHVQVSTEALDASAKRIAELEGDLYKLGKEAAELADCENKIADQRDALKVENERLLALLPPPLHKAAGAVAERIDRIAELERERDERERHCNVMSERIAELEAENERVRKDWKLMTESYHKEIVRRR